MNVSGVGGSNAADAASIANSNGMGKQEFLTLLVTQLRNQDPMNPSQPHEFAAQLAQFSSLEQLVNIAGQLDAQQSMNLAMVDLVNASSALGVLGRDVIATGNSVTVGEDGDANIAFDAGAGGNGIVKVLDPETGETLATVDIGYVDGGRQTASLDADALGLPPGQYRFAVEVTDANGEAVPVTTLITGRVDGIRYGENGPMLVCGSIEIPLGAVVEVNTLQES